MTATVPRPPAAAPAPARSLRSALRKVAEALASPLVPEDYVDLVDPLRVRTDLRGRILQIRPETADAATIVVRLGRGWAGHRAGQYLRIGVDIDGVRQWRTYSLTSTAGMTDPDTITFTTKAVPGGLVSNHLVRGGAKPGDLVHLDQAAGDFVLPSPLPGKILFLTAGSGITPVIGMLRTHGLDLPDVVVLHSALRPEDVIFGDELRRYAALGRLRLLERHTDLDGMIDLGRDLDTLVPDWRERQVWACGPGGLLDAAEAHWAGAGFADALHVERFQPTLAEPGEGGEITFLTSAITVETDGSTSILDAGEEAGILMPHGCRMGICYGCVTTMKQGAVRDLRTGDLTTAEPGAEVPVQTCINAVAGSADLEI